MRIVILTIVLVLVAVQKDHTRFIYPDRPIVFTLSGSVEITAQWYIRRHADNRKYRMAWNGPNCGGAREDPIQGADDAAVFPASPALIRVCEGENELRLTVYGPGDTVRDGATMMVRVCGSAESCT